MRWPTLHLNARHSIALLLVASLAWGVAALYPTDTPRRELIVIRDISDSVSATSDDDWQAIAAPFLASADRVQYIDTAMHATWQENTNNASASTPRDPFFSSKATNYEEAVRLADALPREEPLKRRILLVGDGRETKGEAATFAHTAADRLRIDVIPRGKHFTPDAALLSASLPGTAHPGVTFPLSVTARAEPAQQVMLRVFSGDDTELYASAITLTPVSSRHEIPLTIAAAGMHRLRIQLDASKDSWKRNNIAHGALLVRSAQALVWVGGKAPSGIDASPVLPEALTKTDILGASCVVLDNVSQDALPPGAVSWLQQSIRLGCGLIVLGGEESLGVGGYALARKNDPPLETLLPVTITPRDKLAIMFVVDASGSMGEAVPGTLERVRKISLAGTALREGWNRLTENDDAGILVFANDIRQIRALSPVSPGETFQPETWLAAGGGTRLLGALQEASKRLAGVRAAHRAILCITDGETGETAAEQQQLLASLSKDLKHEGIGLQCLLMNNTSEKTTLSALTDIPGVQLIPAHADLLKLPALLRDAVERQRTYQQTDGRIAMQQTHPALGGITKLPSILARYYAVGAMQPKNRGQSLLESNSGDVFAAVGRVGLGRVALMAGHPVRDWGWTQQTGADVVRNLLGWSMNLAKEKTTLEADIRGQQLHVRYSQDNYPDEMRPLSLLINETPQIDLLPVAPGRWEGQGDLPPSDTDMMLLEVRSQSNESLAQRPLFVEDRQEWLDTGVDGAALARIAEATGGEVWFAPPQHVPWDSVPVSGLATGNDPVWTWILLGAVFFAMAFFLRAHTRVP